MSSEKLQSIFLDTDLVSKLLELRLRQTLPDFYRLFRVLPKSVQDAALRSHKTRTTAYYAGARVLPAVDNQEARLFWLEGFQ